MSLPARRDPPVLEGQVVGEPARTMPRQAARTIAAAVRHDRARAAGRNVAYVGIGAAVITRRLWESRSIARYERSIRSAEAAGDHEAALAWDAQRIKFSKDRHQRRADLVELPLKVFKALPGIAAGFLGILVVIGVLMAIASKNVKEIAAPVKTTARVTELAVILFSVAWVPLLWAAAAIIVLALYLAGRSYANASLTSWSVAGKDDGEDPGLVVTADTIVLALQHLPIPDLRKAFKDGWKPTFHTLPIKDGRGYFTVYSLPLGVTAEMIADRRPVLARNVHRAEVEVWPSDAEKAGVGPAGTAAVWIADPGVLSKPAPEYPLLHEGTADVFAGVPGGVSPRGDQLLIPVVANNFVVGGQMGQGKSNAIRVFMLGCALDPLAELDVFVFANNGDFDAFRPRLARYVKGVEDDAVAAAVHRLHELYAEVARREDRLAELRAKKVTRQLAATHADMRPVVVAFSECHELFDHDEHGAIAADLATKTIKRARKTGITLLFDTQSSRKEAIPPKLVELVSVNACFYVKTWRSNDGFLGDGSFAAGIRATELRPGRDVGTSLITGVSDAQFELLRWHFVEVNDDTGFDAAADVIARAVARVARGTAIGGSAPAAIETRDLLEDLAEVLGDERVKLADLPALLRDLAPTWGPYRALTGIRLKDLLAAQGVRVVTKANISRLDPADLRDALAGRDEG